MFKWNAKFGQWIDDKSGKILDLPEGGVEDKLNSAVKKKDSKKKEEKECPGHKDAIKVLSKTIDVWAGSANKTEKFPNTLILDLADRYGNGLSVEGEGIELPHSLIQPRVIFDWPDMSKPVLWKTEWETLVDWLKSLEIVQKHGLYVACLEGHGRTGTCLAILAHYLGEWPKADLVQMIRKVYCYKAVETSSQIQYFENMTGRKTTCKESNISTYMGSGTSNYAPKPCYKRVQGVTVECLHTCSCTGPTHIAHWCPTCKWDWWVDKSGLHEKPAPNNTMTTDRSDHITVGKFVVETFEKGQVTLTETWDGETVPEAEDTKSRCWEISGENHGVVGDCTETGGDSHFCGLPNRHAGKHSCSLCPADWDDEDDKDLPPAPQGRTACLATGGDEIDHRCLCTMSYGHETIHDWKHKCSTCLQMFEEREEYS